VPRMFNSRRIPVLLGEHGGTAMKCALFLLLISCTVLLASCTPAVSVRPLYIEEDTPTKEPAIEGDWISPSLEEEGKPKPVELTWKVTPNAAGTYDVEVRRGGDEPDKSQVTTRYDVQLVSLNGKLFFDADFLQVAEGAHVTFREGLELGTVPVHLPGRLIVQPDLLIIQFLFSEWVHGNAPDSFQHKVVLGKSDVTVITGTTPELREFLLKQADNLEAFQYVRYLCRPNTDCIAKAYEYALTVSPKDQEALAALAGHYLQAGNYARASQLLQRASELKPKDTSIKNRLGTALLMDRKYEDARHAFSSALDIQPGNLEAQQGIGWSYFLNGDFTQAAAAFNNSLGSSANTSAEPALLAYVALRKSGNVEESEVLLSKEFAEFNGPPEEQLLLLSYAGRISSFPYEISGEAAAKSRIYLLAAEGALSHGGLPTRELWECILTGGKDSLYAAVAKLELEKLSSPPTVPSERK
jgi:tetratricopeptide (TPR) repeat protein